MKFIKVRTDQVATKVSNRCNLSYFVDIIADLSQSKKDVIKKYSFVCFIDFEKYAVLRSFVQWIANHIDTKIYDIIIYPNLSYAYPLRIRYSSWWLRN